MLVLSKVFGIGRTWFSVFLREFERLNIGPRPDRYQVPPLHGLLHLLDSPVAASSHVLQAHTQAASQVARCVAFPLLLLSMLMCAAVPTPFASHAFHPVDGYAQAIPYHVYAYLFPMHRVLYLALFVGVNTWSIFVSSSPLSPGRD